jgi:hypothetical protein
MDYKTPKLECKINYNNQWHAMAQMQKQVKVYKNGDKNGKPKNK